MSMPVSIAVPRSPRAYLLTIALAMLGILLFSAVGTTSPAHAQSSGNAAADLQASLDNLLSEHADLAMLAMQKGYDGAADFQAAATQLSQNTDALSAAVGSVYGADAAAKFKTLWTNHIGFFVDYTKAVKANDAAAKQKALSDLAGYKGDIAALLSGANPNLPNAAVQQTFQTHIDQLTGALDGYAAKDYAKAYSNYHQGHDHMFMAGATLAGGIAKQMPQKFPGNPASSGATLQATLDNLLSEHADLAMLAMQKGYDGAADFQAAATQLSQNTDALSAAVGSVYGNDAAAKFKTLWTNHIGFFVDYTKAIKGNDAAAKQKALSDLGNYKNDIATLLNGANPNLPKDAVAQAFQAHIDQLTGQIDAYGAKDYAKTYSDYHKAHDHMFMTAATLAGGIAKQMPQKFSFTAGVSGQQMPQMPNTGTAGLIGSQSSNPLDTVVVLLFAAAACGLMLGGGAVVLSRRAGR